MINGKRRDLVTPSDNPAESLEKPLPGFLQGRPRTSRPQHLENKYREYEKSRFAEGRRLVEIVGHYRSSSDLAGLRVMDLGSGDGYITLAFAASRARVVAVEADVPRLSKFVSRVSLHEQTNRFQYLAADAHLLPFSDGEFDVVILFDVLEHVRNPSVVAQEIARVLRPGGMVFVATTNRFSVVNLVSDPHYNAPGIGLMPRPLAAWYVTRLLRLSSRYNVEEYFSRRRLVRLLTQAGLREEEVGGRYEEKIIAGNITQGPGRGWIIRLLRKSSARKLALRFCRTSLFRYFFQPGWEFVAWKNYRAAEGSAVSPTSGPSGYADR